MRVLTPTEYKVGPVEGVQITATLLLKGGKGTYLCDVFEEIVEAMHEGLPFLAHEVIGMQASEIIVNPAHVATVSRAS